MVANILIKVITGALQFIAILLHGLIPESLTIDNLVFNTSGDGFGVLTLFKGGSAGQEFLATFYNVFNYIAIGMFIPLILWSGFKIVKAGESPQEKSIMKDRLTKIALTFCLLYTMPELLTLLVRVSNGFVEIFKSVGEEFLGVSNSKNLIDAFITPLSLSDLTIADAISALILVGVNIWIIGFFIIRDLTVAFLFLIYPIIAIWYPFNGSMTKNWWVGMAGNILAQPIQAMVFTLVLSLAKALEGGGAWYESGPGFAYSLYIIVGFASIIPMTSLVKSFLGLESGIGAGSSRAGLGGAMAAVMMAKQMKDGIKGSVDDVREGKGIKENADILESQMEKNLPSSSSSAEEIARPLLNPNTSTFGDILDSSSKQGKIEATRALGTQRRVGGMQIAKGWGSLTTGVVGSVVGASIGAGMTGSSRGAAMLGGVGYMAGSDVGGHIASTEYDSRKGLKANQELEGDLFALQSNIAHDLTRDELVSEGYDVNLMNQNDIRSMALDKLNPESANYDMEFASRTRDLAENKYLGLNHEKLDGTEWQAQERKAKMNAIRRSNTSASIPNQRLAQLEYARMTPSRKSPHELSQINDAHIYQDKDKSIVYRPLESGAPEVLAVGKGNPYISEPINNPVTFSSDQNLGLPNDIMYDIQTRATKEARDYMTEVHPDIELNTPEYTSLYNDKVSEYKREARFSHNDNLKSMQENLNIPNINIRTSESRLKDLIDKEKQQIVKEQELAVERRREEVRAKTRLESKKQAFRLYTVEDLQ